jgi:hypothetical protein
VHALGLDGPVAVCIDEGEARHGDGAAVHEIGVAADTDPPAPGPLADERSEAEALEVVREASPPEEDCPLMSTAFGPVCTTNGWCVNKRTDGTNLSFPHQQDTAAFVLEIGASGP